MTGLQKNTLIGAAVLAVAGVLLWLWFDNMEQRWISRDKVSEAAARNRMLGATLLLSRTGRQVTLANSLSEVVIPELPDGMLIAADRHGLVSPRQGRELLAWVRRGNTLVTQPRWMTQAEAEPPTDSAGAPAADPAARPPVPDLSDLEPDLLPGDEARGAAGTDPLGERLGVRIRRVPELDDCPARARKAASKALRDQQRTACKEALAARMAQRGTVTPPGLPYPLYLDSSSVILASLPGAQQPVWSDERGEVIRVYAEGKGHIAMLSDDFFHNGALRTLDHAELLLAVAALNPSSKRVTIVKHLDALPWHKALWRYASHALIALALTLALLLWASVRRFGPVLAPPDPARRSLIEHIEASSAWLWKAQGGRQLLLDAARADTMALIGRRAPALSRMGPEEMAATLARLCGIGQSHVVEALQRPASSQLFQFTRQIRTLQILRNHHER